MLLLTPPGLSNTSLCDCFLDMMRCDVNDTYYPYAIYVLYEVLSLLDMHAVEIIRVLVTLCTRTREARVDLAAQTLAHADPQTR